MLGGKSGSNSSIGLQTTGDDGGPSGGSTSQRRRREDDDGYREQPYGRKGDLVGLCKPSTHNLLQIEENENDDYGLEQVDTVAHRALAMDAALQVCSQIGEVKTAALAAQLERAKVKRLCVHAVIVGIRSIKKRCRYPPPTVTNEGGTAWTGLNLNALAAWQLP